MVMLRWLLARQQASNFVLFAGGRLGPSGTATITSEKYFIATDSVSSGASLSVNHINYGRAAIGNRTSAFIAGGSDSAGNSLSSVDKYTFANDVFASATSLTDTRARHACSSSATFGVIAGGIRPTLSTLTTRKYEFSSESDSAGTNLSGNARYAISGSGNLTIGLFVGGLTDASIAQANVDKYTYSTDSVSGGTALSSARYNQAASSISSTSYIAGGFVTAVTLTTLKYEHSTDVISSGTNLSGSARQLLGGSGDSSKGIFAGGLNSSSAYLAELSVYTYSGDTVAAGTALATARAGHGGICSYPGHL